MLQEIPLTNRYNQELTTIISLNDLNVGFRFNIKWNKTANYWVMTVTDIAEDTILIDSLPLVTGKLYTSSLDILRKLGYLNIGKCYVVPRVSKPTSDYPNETNLNSDFALVWGDDSD
jgi:hypothetical protein